LSVIVFLVTPLSAAPGIVIGSGAGPGLTSLNHFSIDRRAAAESMSPATTRLALAGE